MPTLEPLAAIGTHCVVTMVTLRLLHIQFMDHVGGLTSPGTWVEKMELFGFKSGGTPKAPFNQYSKPPNLGESMLLRLNGEHHF